MKIAASLGILLVVLLAFCAQPSEKPTTPATTPPQTTPSDLLGVYRGFKVMQKGEWARWRVSDGQVTTLTYVFAGKEVLDGKSVSGIEFSSKIEGREEVIQIWFTDDGSAFKYVIKVPEGVFCTPIVQVGNVPSPSTPEEYEPQKIAKLRYELGKHTVSGKVINVVKVFEGKNETWISGDVPFGMVRVSIEGKTVMDLIDFGSNLSPKISFNEVLNCKQIQLPRLE